MARTDAEGRMSPTVGRRLSPVKSKRVGLHCHPNPLTLDDTHTCDLIRPNVRRIARSAPATA